ncbi:MAG: hypothetical protein GX025_05385 [Clostridiales bacterium]|nr:hypothetical protein [Clostridiales bacterium]
MLTSQQINELEFIINYLNNTESPKKEDIQDKAEDLDYLLKVLSTVKTSKIKRLFKKPVNKEFELVSTSYDKENVMKLFASSCNEDIIKDYSLAQLKEMFTAVYGKKPMSKSKKEDIANSIDKMLQQIERVEGFNELGK